MARSLFSNSMSRWAQAIIVHYATNRGEGNTYHQEHGWVSHYDGPGAKIILFPDRQTAEAADAPGCVTVTLDQSPTCIAGMAGPLIVEHRALTLILAGIGRDLRIAQEKEYRATRKAVKAKKAVARVKP